MTNHRPLIGITPGYDYEQNKLYVKRGYYEGVNQAGGLAIVLPVATNEDILLEAIDRCDGFLISGGPDVDARLYGEHNLPFNDTISPYRDCMEILIIKKAFELNKPIFGICRGIQIMNIALGGTLYQNIYSQAEGKCLIKHSQSAPEWYPTHEICIEKGSRVWAAFMKEHADVNSFHHQAIKDVAPGFIVTSRTTDGIIESIEHTSQAFALGVQWHPELMWEENRLHLKLFEEFVSNCSAQFCRIY